MKRFGGETTNVWKIVKWITHHTKHYILLTYLHNHRCFHMCMLIQMVKGKMTTMVWPSILLGLQNSKSSWKTTKKIFNFNLKIRICKATVSLRHVKWKRPEVSIYFLSFSDILTLFKIFLTMQEYFFPLRNLSSSWRSSVPFFFSAVCT